MNSNSDQAQEEPSGRQWHLSPQSEYRFELDPDVTLAIQLIAGRAEIFGSELAPNRTYVYGNECKAAIFTWHGCTLEVKGQPSTEYISEETPMASYSNLHVAFEQMRIRAKNQPQNADPPRVMVIGPENSGKTSACKVLANYAVKVSRVSTPILVNLDPSDGGWTIPGSVSASVVTSPIPTSTPASPFGCTATSAPTALLSSALIPIVYWYGHSDVKRNQPMMERSIENLTSAVKQRMAADSITYGSGLYIDTPASFATAVRMGNEMRYPFVETCVEKFDVNVIIVIGHEKLNVDMQRHFGNSGRRISVIKVAKSGGVVDLDWAYRTRVLSYQFRTYFYGPFLNIPTWIDPSTLGGEASLELHLSPYSTTIKFNDIKIYRIGAESMAPSSALPIGASRVITELEPTVVDPNTTGLLNTVLALLPLPSTGANVKIEDEGNDVDLVASDVQGFLLVAAVDMMKQRLTILSPNPGSLVGRTALIGSYEWQDQ